MTSAAGGRETKLWEEKRPTKLAALAPQRLLQSLFFLLRWRYA